MNRIIPLQEYVDILVESRREELFLEASNNEMSKVYADHYIIINKYIKSAKEKKKSGLFKECRADLIKAKSEIKLMENDIRNMNSTMFESIMSIAFKYIIAGLMDAITYGIIHIGEKHTENINNIKNSRKIINIINIVGVSASAVIDSIRVTVNYRKQIKKGSDKANALNQYKNYILNSCERTMKYIDNEIKFIDMIIESN